jgi:hypothetical protein
MVGETSAGKLVVEIVGDVAGLTRAYDEAVKRTEGFEGNLKTIGSRLTSIGSDLTLKVTAPLALAGAGMVKLAGDAAETQSKFEQVFGAMSEDVEAWADSYGNSVGRATTDLQDMLATSGSIVKAMGLVEEEGAKFSETITQLSIDMASFHNAADIEAFNALRSAITGEYEPMKRFGVVINEAKVEQELLTMGISGGTKAATDAEKAQARLNIIMRATTGAQGDAARTADSFSNQMKALVADGKELGEEFGQVLLPLAQDLISTVRGGIAWLSGFDEGTQRVIVTTGLLAAATGPVIWGLGTLAGSVGSLISLYRTYQASTIAATIATKGFSAAIMANPIGLAIIGVTTLGAVLLPLITSTRDATDATQEYGESLKDIQDLTEKTTETIEDEIDALREMERELRNQISVIRSQYTPVTERQTAATRRATQETNWQKLATGELVGEFRNATEAAQRQTSAIDGLTQSQKDAIIAAKELEIAEIEKARVIRETELATRRLADGAKIAYDQASKAVSGHQRTVSDLQKEYNDLKDTIDRALGIDKEIETAERDVERAEIRTIRARQTLADLEKEIKEKELEIRTATFEDADDRARAERDLVDLKLRHREAVLDVADAEDRYQDALIESQTVKEEKTEIETELDGESISSAQNRLDEIGKLLEEEQQKLDVALQAREEAQIAHENLMNQIENEALEVKSQNWKEYVEYVNNNPAIARTYHVEYDADGNPKGGLPQIPTVNIQVPSYASPAFDQTTTAATTNGSAPDAGATSATSGTGINIPTAATVGGGGVSVTLNQNIYTQTQTAGEVQAATERGLRDAALQGVL